ncbi:MAG: STAS domain-containing protein [Planctomycetes bacterium]|nr:STAS domain-containing protein [Planctomycetota bacterium]
MNLTLDFAQQDKVYVIKLHGRFIGKESTDFQNQISENIGSDGKNVVIDLGELHYIGSQGASALVALTVKHKVKLANLSKQIKNTFDLLKLEEIFEIFDTVDAAVTSFGSA